MFADLSYRQAQPDDAERIGLLHADSWKRNYRGALEDDFLDKRVDQNRIHTWHERLTNTPSAQWTLLAEQDAALLGFICVFGSQDPAWGSLIDNLHVAHAAKGQSIGTWLMMQARNWLNEYHAANGVYLWVVQNNTPARRFYEMLGATDNGAVSLPNPAGGGSAFYSRYSWATPVDIRVSCGKN